MKRVLFLAGIGISFFTATWLPAQAQCLQNWTYTTPVTITNANPTPLLNFQVKLVVNTAALVGAGHMQASGNDIRFTQGNCCNELCYYIESGMNTSSTTIWVKLDSIAASGTATIQMNYGNPSATDGQNPQCTFDLWEPFDNTPNHFTPSCGAGTYGVSAGVGTIGWSSNYVAVSDLTFDMDTVYTAEMNITAASGNWPGINFSGVTAGSNFGYSMLLGSGVRIGKAGSSAPDYCRGENWASTVYTTPPSVTGLWSITWINTGNIIGDFPGLGLLTSTDVEHSRNQDLKLCIGGISGGTGSMSMDWVRVRKYAAVTPTFTTGSETSLSFLSVSLGPDTSFCGAINLNLDAGSGFTSYTWSGIASGTTQTTTVNTAGQVIVIAVDASSCPSTDTLLVSQFPPVNVDLGPDVMMCMGDTASLDAGSGFSTYLWSVGTTTQSIQVFIADTFEVEVTDANGCSASDTIVVGLYPNPTAAFTQTSVSQTTTFTNTSTGATSYFWDFGDGNTSTAMDTIHTFTTPGTYNVCLTVTSSNGCTASTCTSVTVTNTGIHETMNEAGISLYPNPATHTIWLNSLTQLETVQVGIVDMLGKTVFVKTYPNLTQQSIDITTLHPGNYVVQIHTGGKIYYTNLVVAK
jgi:hypothetical protein